MSNESAQIQIVAVSDLKERIDNVGIERDELDADDRSAIIIVYDDVVPVIPRLGRCYRFLRETNVRRSA